MKTRGKGHEDDGNKQTFFKRKLKEKILKN